MVEGTPELVTELPANDETGPVEYDLDNPEWYLSRELTWIRYNHRVLAQVENPRTPLLERVKFLAIAAGNLDEFTMTRIGRLKQQVAAGYTEPGVDGYIPGQHIQACYQAMHDFHDAMEVAWGKLLTEMGDHDIRIVPYDVLDADQKSELRKKFVDDIFPLITPLAMDPSHPFPFISNLVLNLLVTLRFPGEKEQRMARIKLPVIRNLSPRFVRIGSSRTFVILDDVVSNNLDLIFPGMEIESCEIFRITRNANFKVKESADDLLESIESEIRQRHFAPIVRMEVTDSMSAVHRGMLAAELGLDEAEDVFELDGMLAMSDMMEIASLDIPELHDAPHHPIDNPRLANGPNNIFHNIRDGGSILLQHPYESFETSVERFLRSAANDPKVLAIKMTLYRVSAKGTIIDLLLQAAANGKQVAVLVELKASFDEEANIGWAKSLERQGVHVTYGVLGLKTHCKTILVVRRDYDGLRRYAHIGTGNYHSDTASLYSDLGMLTCDVELAQDLTELFNYLTGYSPPPSYRKILAAPYTLKRSLLSMIDREIEVHCKETPGLIQFKCNALEDPDIVRALYRASMAGVHVDLIVRDSCRLIPGVPGLSDNIHVISVLGRFLEHARIYYFRNGGNKEYYIGSADLMRRNLSGRVEVVTPVEQEDLREDLRLILDIQLSDQSNAWDMKSDCSYELRHPEDGKESRGSQDMLMDMSNTRLQAARKHQQKKVRRKLVNHFKKRIKRKR